MESDWQKFRALVPVLRERFLAEQNDRIARLLAEPIGTPTDRFWAAHEAMDDIAKTLRRCLDGHSRSNMRTALIAMREAGMLTEGDMDGFSDELRKRLFGGER